jgi:hypothetical protein
MKKTFRKLSVLLCAVLTMTMLLGMTVFAGSENNDGFDFGAATMTLTPGGSQTTFFRRIIMTATPSAIRARRLMRK